MPKALTDTEQLEILRLHEQGLSRNAICRQVGRSAGVVSKVVKNAGGTFARGHEVVEATEAKRVDNAAKRADMIARLYAQAGHLLDRLEAPQFKVTGDSWGKAVVSSVPREATPPADIRHLGATAVNMLHACAKLEDVDKAGAGAAEGKGIIGTFFATLENAERQDAEA